MIHRNRIYKVGLVKKYRGGGLRGVIFDYPLRPWGIKRYETWLFVKSGERYITNRNNM